MRIFPVEITAGIKLGTPARRAEAAFEEHSALCAPPTEFRLQDQYLRSQKIWLSSLFQNTLSFHFVKRSQLTFQCFTSRDDARVSEMLLEHTERLFNIYCELEPGGQVKIIHANQLDLGLTIACNALKRDAHSKLHRGPVDGGDNYAPELSEPSDSWIKASFGTLQAEIRPAAPVSSN